MLRVAEAIAERLRGAALHEVPDRLCGLAVELLPVCGASVSLLSEGLSVPVGASDEAAAGMAEMQTSLGDGPWQRAAEHARPVLAGDLTAGRDVLRWPVYAEQATAAGIRATYSLPLGNETVCLGTFDLYSATPGPLSAHDLRVARLVAGVLTVALSSLPCAQEDTIDPASSWLSGLTSEHDQIHQAVGMIMAQLGVTAEEALARLRGHAFSHGRTALETAHDVVRHRERLEDPD
ncbi:GAF and ANTAR domain-containing protein [Streptomyces sp. NPDC006739]|uniref:GAF and ANTAR domain-containing protein n=1 Tax=Streptomyces sp. NPDC006739 TaxID=3364763 RepID=UPI0036AA149B